MFIVPSGAVGGGKHVHVPSGAVGGGKHVHCAKWRSSRKRTVSTARITAVNSGKYVYCSADAKFVPIFLSRYGDVKLYIQ